MSGYLSNSQAASARDPRLERALRTAIVAGLALALLLPARSHWLGWTPLWLLGMPLSAWWALHRFRLPRPTMISARRRRRPGGKARRRHPTGQRRLLRAA